MTTKLNSFLLKLSIDSKEREAFKKSPIKVMKAAKLSDADIVHILSGALDGGKPNIPISQNVRVNIIVKTQIGK